MSVVVPAHNEGRVLGRLLSGLLDGAGSAAFEILVVANGCTDDTAEVAASFGPAVRVLVTPEANKHRAMRLADKNTDSFPRLYVDADVELSGRDAIALGERLAEDEAVLAVAPERRLPTEGCPWTVRWYYDVWSKLPVVRTSLFGRGVIGVSEAGYARLATLPELMGDDLAASLSFEPGERAIVPGTHAVVHPPRTLGDLLRRRVRTVTVTAQAGQREELASAGAEARTSRGDLLAVLRAAPVGMAPRVAWFLAVTLLARRRARRAVKAEDFTTWLRDESSREAEPVPAGRPAP